MRSELLLILEAHQTVDRQSWRYAVARFNSYALEITDPVEVQRRDRSPVVQCAFRHST